MTHQTFSADVTMHYVSQNRKNGFFTVNPVAQTLMLLMTNFVPNFFLFFPLDNYTVIKRLTRNKNILQKRKRNTDISAGKLTCRFPLRVQTQKITDKIICRHKIRRTLHI
jgi:hypothetical protein